MQIAQAYILCKFPTNNHQQTFVMTATFPLVCMQAGMSPGPGPTSW